MFTFAEYNAAAARTEKYTVTDWRQNIPVNLYRGLHGILGLSSEISELSAALHAASLDHTNIVEELGDLWWYAALLYRVTYNLPFPDPKVEGGFRQRHPEIEVFGRLDHPYARDAAKFELTVLTEHVGEGADLCKRSLYYGKVFNPSTLQDREIIASLQLLTMYCGANIYEVWKVNIAKLWARFPSEFTGDLAINRDTAAELEIMVQKRLELKAQKEAAANAVPEKKA